MRASHTMYSFWRLGICLIMIRLLLGCTATQPDLQAEQSSPAVEIARVSAAIVDDAPRSIVIEVAVDEAVPEQNDLWARLRNGFALDHEVNRRRVQQEIDWFLKHPDYIDRVVARADHHLFYIVEQLEAQGMPLELTLLPVVESAFDPFAYSHGRASGLWQFIPSTARLHGIRIDWWYDGRRDIPDSTEAAIKYLSKLHTLLNDDWLLALAAYNSGQGNLGQSIRRNKRAGKPQDFWSLDVFRETRSYVPRLLAISAIIADPEHYGITLRPVANEPYWAEVNIGSQLDLVKAAELADMTTEQLYQLNPGFNQWSTHPQGPHRLLLPIDAIAGFTEKLDALPVVQRLAWKRHIIRRGENLGGLARKYHTTVAAIIETNALKGHVIKTGDTLTIPMAGQTNSMTAQARLSRHQSRLEKKLGTKPVRYTVQAGDSYWKIAAKFGVGMRQLAKWNGKGTTQTLRIGEELLIFTVIPTPSVAISPPGRDDIIRKVNYRVRPGESLSLIADRFNLSVDSIKRWNQDLRQQKYIQPGDRITLYVDVTATE